MVQSSFNRTSADLEADQIAHHYAANDDFSIDQVTASSPAAWGFTSSFHVTYSPVDNTSAATTPICGRSRPSTGLATHSLRVGVRR